MKIVIPIVSGLFFFSACSNAGDHTSHLTENKQTSQRKSSNAMKKAMDDMMDRMHSVQSVNNNDIDFARMMTEHHQGAVVMSTLLLRTGADSALGQFAKQVINAQGKEIGFMDSFINKYRMEPSKDAAIFQQALQHSMMAMMQKNIPVYNNADKDYAALMIPHHQSAVDMARVYVQFGKNEILMKMCSNIIDSQSKEIAWLGSWLITHK